MDNRRCGWSHLYLDGEAELHAALVVSAMWQCAIHSPGWVSSSSRSTVCPIGTSTVSLQTRLGSGAPSRARIRKRPSPRLGSPVGAHRDAAVPLRRDGAGHADHQPLTAGWAAAEARQAFAKVVRQRRASLLRRVLRRCADSSQLRVLDADSARRSSTGHGVRDIPLDAITGRLEPHRAAAFDHRFRPSPRLQSRWLSVWIAEEQGAGLPPIPSRRSATCTRSEMDTTACRWRTDAAPFAISAIVS